MQDQVLTWGEPRFPVRSLGIGTKATGKGLDDGGQHWAVTAQDGGCRVTGQVFNASYCLEGLVLEAFLAEGVITNHLT